LKQKLEEKVASEFKISGEGHTDIYAHLRSVSNGTALQLSNMSRTAAYRISLEFSAPGTVAALWNPLNGECLKLVPDADGRFTLEFAPAQTWMVTTGYSAKNAKFDNVYSLPAARVNIYTFGKEWTGKRLDPNTITLDFASFSTDGGKSWSKEEPVLAYYDRSAAKKPYNGPLMMKYKVKIDELPGTCVLALEQPEMYQQILVNGRDVKFTGNGFFIDASIKTQDIHQFLKQGDNEIVLSLDYVTPIPTSLVASERYGTEIESIYLAGDFGVTGIQSEQQLVDSWYNQTEGLAKKPLATAYKSFTLSREKDIFEGDLTQAGFPFYAGRFVLENTFDLPDFDPDAAYTLAFPACETILTGATINGTEMPFIFATPFEVDVTKALKQGKNEIKLTLTNSLRNLMGPHHHKGGELTEVGPASFRANNGWPNNIEKGEPDWYDARLRGNPILWRDDYFVIPFGLLRPPVLQKDKK
jgi:hypothetical protein